MDVYCSRIVVSRRQQKFDCRRRAELEDFTGLTHQSNSLLALIEKAAHAPTTKTVHRSETAYFIDAVGYSAAGREYG